MPLGRDGHQVLGLPDEILGRRGEERAVVHAGARGAVLLSRRNAEGVMGCVQLRLGTGDLGFDAQAANDIANKKGGDDGTSSSTSTKLYTAHKRVDGSVSHYRLTRQVKGESWMMCNEAKHSGSIGGWISYVKSMMSGMGTNNKPF